MTKKQFTFVANWKTYFSTHQAQEWLIDHYKELARLADNNGHVIIVCPDMLSLPTFAQKLNNSDISVGAQNCSDHNQGAFTGEITAQSLQDIECLYCIVGHSERRRLYGETTEMITKKAVNLFMLDLSPIICVGETAQERDAGKTIQIIGDQLLPILTAMQNIESGINVAWYIAYEPVWAIGSNQTPTNDQINQVFEFITNLVHSMLPHASFELLYGGSVDETNAKQLRTIPLLNGFLLGRASLDFQKFEKIVTCF